MGPGSVQWCPVTGQGATGTNWNTGSSYKHEGKLLYGKGDREQGQASREVVQSPSLKYSRFIWTPTCATH